jgi:hypothetical protein
MSPSWAIPPSGFAPELSSWLDWWCYAPVRFNPRWSLYSVVNVRTLSSAVGHQHRLTLLIPYRVPLRYPRRIPPVVRPRPARPPLSDSDSGWHLCAPHSRPSLDPRTIKPQLGRAVKGGWVGTDNNFLYF